MRRSNVRDYAKENRNYKGKPEQIEKRSSRNQARATLKEALGERKMRGKEVEHIDGNPLNNSRSNLKLVTPSDNNQGRRGGPSKSTMAGRKK